jgi:8-oxo-dGTP diphosphatase
VPDTPFQQDVSLRLLRLGENGCWPVLCFRMQIDDDRFPLLGSPIEKVVGAILRNGGRMLLCLRSRAREQYPGVWDVPGGHVAEHESLQDALVRELREELGIRINVPDGRPWRIGTFEGAELSLFVVDGWDGEIRNCAPHEHEAVRWVSVEELPQLHLAHPLYRTLLAEAMAAPPT